jgi:succinate dehydrogenase/fumarate reductase cytochrome b subunit
MLFRYRGSEGMVAWAFHRISGIGIFAFVLLHVFDIFLAGGTRTPTTTSSSSTPARPVG